MVTKIVDARGLNCPLPILRAKKALNDVPIDGMVEVLTTDQGSKEDFPAFARQTGNTLIKVEEFDNYFRFLIQRKV
jgi:tRNA 2-thiouridine synthesizing protein A